MGANAGKSFYTIYAGHLKLLKGADRFKINRGDLRLQTISGTFIGYDVFDYLFDGSFRITFVFVTDQK